MSTSGLTTTEASGTARSTVVLTSVLSANVTIGISSPNATEGTVSSSSLTFTSGKCETDKIVGDTLTIDVGAKMAITPYITTPPVYLPRSTQTRLIESAFNHPQPQTPIYSWIDSTALHRISENQFENLLPEKRINEARTEIFPSLHDELPVRVGIIEKRAKTQATNNRLAHYAALQAILEKTDVGADLGITRHTRADKKAKHLDDAVDAVLAEEDVVFVLL